MPHTIVKAKTEYSRVPDESRSHLELTLEARAEPSLLGAGLVTLQSVEINENDSVQENGQNKSASKTVQTYPPISDICQGILNVSVGIEGRGY